MLDNPRDVNKLLSVTIGQVVGSFIFKLNFLIVLINYINKLNDVHVMMLFTTGTMPMELTSSSPKN